MPDAPQVRSTGQVARRTLVISLASLAVVALALALWNIRLILGLFFFGIVVASAMRPGVDALHRRGLPRGLGVAVHYVLVCAVVAVLLVLAVPRAVSQIENAVSGVPATKTELEQEVARSDGFKRDFLLGLQRRLDELPSRSELFVSALELTRTGVEVVVGIFFLFASAAYWIFERERAERLILSAVPRRRRDVVRDTWRLVDLKLGAFVRGQLLLILLVGSVLSFAFWAIGLPYWLLIGAFAGIVELVPVIGPVVAGALAIGVGLTVSWELALYAGIIVLAVRLLEDYLVLPRVMGGAVSLSPLIVLASISAAGVLFGGLAVLLAIPLAAVAATIVDVVLLKRDPAASIP